VDCSSTAVSVVRAISLSLPVPAVMAAEGSVTNGEGAAELAQDLTNPFGNHVWSFAGDDDRQDIRNTFMQPFAACTWLLMLGPLPVSLQAGVG
jgi:hypothetical protein